MASTRVRINKTTGQTTVTTEGYSGATCKEKTKALQERLGITTSDEPTTEMYQNATTDENQNQSN